jgi:2-dehydro-3-deoxyphosphogluconate aldolase/(4S)-4-hydroxy-2-oxoglutarate aldolase
MTDTGLPHLPGVATVSQILSALEAEYTELKFFATQAAGGANDLKSVSSPIPSARFCPTGGISTTNAAQYLVLPNVG